MVKYVYMDFLIILGVVILSVWIANKVAPTIKSEPKPSIPCPPHVWVYMGKEEGNEYMVCKVCGKMPLEDVNS
jgi:hypothetical protein